MKLSRHFVSDYIDIHEIADKDLAEKMVFAGNEYEEIKKISDATGLIIGEVIECVDHPESNHLHLCQVNIGSNILPIVCGAPNVRAGIKVIVAQVGAILPGGMVIKPVTLAGKESHGMICSLEELGIESKYLKEEDKTGIHILDDRAVIGEDPLAFLQYDDTTIDFELTADRADLLSVLGMAYEIGAIYDRPVKLPSISFQETNENINDQMKLSVLTDNCSIYLGKMVKNVVIKDSPPFIKARLMASGIRPINNVVDISNYVMLEYGQPLHFFDADRLGSEVIVRMALEGETIQTLDGQMRTLKATDIVIANQEEAVALAGVMGGFKTEVEQDTKNIFIESAIFDPVHIRYTSKTILRSEASSRYEKGIDPNRTKEALKRACQLLELYADGKVTSGILMHDHTNKEDKEITISLDKINLVLGMNLEEKDVLDIYRRLGFSYEKNENGYRLQIPTRRLDVNIEEDVIEEIGRIYGYEHVVGKLPVAPMKQGKYFFRETLLKSIRHRLEGLGLYQVLTYSLVGETEASQFVNETHSFVTLKAPMSDDKKIMRQSLIPSLLKVMDYNLARHNKDIMIYETGSIYYEEENRYIEKTHIDGLLIGKIHNGWQNREVPVDFYLVKGILVNLLNYLGFQGRYQIEADEMLSNMHPKMTAKIIVDREMIGYFGKVHPKLSKKDVYVFHLDFEKLLRIKVRQIKFKEISKYPSVHKDLAFVVPMSLESESIEKIIRKVGGRLLTQIEVFDVYMGENMEEGKKSIAYALTFQNPTKTLNDEEVTLLFQKMIYEVENNLDAKLRCE